MNIPTTEPTLINAGDTVKWTKSLADYPASAGWALVYTLVNTAQRYTVASVAQGADHLVTIAAAISAAYVPGDYAWRAQVSLAGEVYTVGTGRMTIKPSFAAATDARSQARRMLEAVEATLEGRASSAVGDYEIAGRRLKYIPVPELLVLRDRLRADVAREDAASNVAAGLPDRRRVFVRFGP